MNDSNIGGTINNQKLKWSLKLANDLDSQDGKKDGKINASIWNKLLSSVGSCGNTIVNYITVENAVKSLNYYNNKKDKGKVDWQNYASLLNNPEKNDDTPVDPNSNQPKKPDKPSNPNPPTPSTSEKPGSVGAGTYSEDSNYDTPKDKADGIIDASIQGGTGDCWLLTGLNSLSETKWGRDAIKNAMQINPQTGDITITLKGAYGKNKVFTVTKAELDATKDNDKYSNGDMDTLAFEIAIEKYRRQFGETLDGGQEEEVFRLITGSHNTQRIYDKNNIRTFLKNAKANPEKYAITANFNLGEQAGKHQYHAYNVSRFETDENGINYVILSNPWEADREIKMTEEEFINRSYEIQALANPNGNSYKYSTNSDGKIGNTTASDKTNDKEVASAIYAVANSNPDIIKDSIKTDPSNGNITVTLKGVGKSYTITLKELVKARESGNYTQGDDDVLALEIAIEKFGKEQWGNASIDDAPGLASFATRSGTKIGVISATRAIYLLTGQDGMYAAKENGKYIISTTNPYNNSNLDFELIAEKIKEINSDGNG